MAPDDPVLEDIVELPFDDPGPTCPTPLLIFDP
jgi:hypothetical protein